MKILRAAAILAFLTLSTMLLFRDSLVKGDTGSGPIVTNGLSQFPVFIDGQFSGGVTQVAVEMSGNSLTRGQINPHTEWSDVVPLFFISPLTQGGTLVRTDDQDPRANSTLYAALAPDANNGNAVTDLYLMYDYVPRTNCHFTPGEFIADIQFPIVVGGVSRPITVQVRGAASGTQVSQCVDSSFFDVFIHFNDNLSPDVNAGALDVQAGVGFGPSTLSIDPHLLVELEVPLSIPADFGGIFPPTGLAGVYSPEPAFWRGTFASNVSDPAGSSALFSIHSDGSTTANSTTTPPAPVNLAPEIVCPGAVRAECGSTTGAPPLSVHVQDPDGNALTVQWFVDGTLVQTDYVPAALPSFGPPTSADVSLQHPMGLGTHGVTVSVSDGKADPVTCSTTVVIVDTTPPVITTPSVSAPVLRPSTNRLVDEMVSYEVTDACGGNVTCVLTVSSNETMDHAGEREKRPDWVIVDNHHVLLRAERAHRGSRIYTITIRCTDSSGNASVKSTTVVVPHEGEDNGKDHRDGDDSRRNGGDRDEGNNGKRRTPNNR